MHSVYYRDEEIAQAASSENYRESVGGMWEEMGDHQIAMLQDQGLRPEHRLLDIGCGCLRLGRKAAAYLDPGNYWGTDLVEPLIDAGYRNEIVPVGLQDRLPRSNLIQDPEFTFKGVPRAFEFVIAQSVFTHLPLNLLRLCLARLADHLTAPTTFLFTVFEPVPGTAPASSCLQPRGGIVTHPHCDPYHYERVDISHAARGLPWIIDVIGDWNHPRNQNLVRATLAP